MNLKYFSDPEDAKNFEPFPIVFSRASVAYEGNGASLQANQPGFIEGTKGVYGLGVYEQYSNILTSSLSQDFNEAWTSGTLNGTYTIKIGSGGGSITLSGGATGTVTSGNSLTFTVTSNTVTFTPTGSCLNTIIINKPYPLPWILGGTTRQPDNCYIPASEVKKFLNLSEYNIEILIKNTKQLKDKQKNIHFFNNGQIYAYYNTGGLLALQHGGTFVSESYNFKEDGYSAINFSFLSSIGRIIIENINKTGTLPRPTYGWDVRLGDRIGNDRSINTNMRFICFSSSRSESEIVRRQKFAEANGYYQIDDKVTAFLDLESGLRGYRRTTQ